MQTRSSIPTISVLVFSLFFLSSALYGQSRLPSKKHETLPKAANEISGLIFIGKDSFLLHNDGGNSNDLFLGNTRGEILAKYPLAETTNRDWEDICTDEEGNIFLGDFGNNTNKRREFQIYKINLSTKSTDTIVFSLKEQKSFELEWVDRHFDMEAMIWYKGFLYVFTKDSFRSKKCMTYQYKIDPKISKQNAILVDSISFENTVITGAAIHSETGKIALVGYYAKYWGKVRIPSAHLILLDQYKDDLFFQGQIVKSRIPRLRFMRQYEAIDFQDEQILLVGSERGIFNKKPRIDWFKTPQ